MHAYYRVVSRRLDSDGTWSQLFTTEDEAREVFDRFKTRYEEIGQPSTLTLTFHDKNGKVRCLEVY